MGSLFDGIGGFPLAAMDMLQLDEAEFELIQRARRGECLYKCGMERYHLEVKAPTHKAVLFGSAGGR